MTSSRIPVALLASAMCYPAFRISSLKWTRWATCFCSQNAFFFAFFSAANAALLPCFVILVMTASLVSSISLHSVIIEPPSYLSFGVAILECCFRRFAWRSRWPVDASSSAARSCWRLLLSATGCCRTDSLHGHICNRTSKLVYVGHR